MKSGLRYTSSLVLFTLILFNVQAQDECARTRNKKTEDILKDFPFNQAKKIKVVSFKSKKEDIVYEIPKVHGQIDIERLHEIKNLSKRNKYKLLDLLVNVNYVPVTDSNLSNDSIEVREIEVMECYTPRHAILFENELGQVFSYVEICIECLRVKTYPESLDIGEFCVEKYQLLENFFGEIGIVYGIGRNGMRWLDE